MVYLNNLFGEIPEKNVTFVIDSSGSMYDTLPSIKDHIIEILIERAYNRPDTAFNIIDFNSEITEWADRMVECTPVTVNAAMRWLRAIETRPGSNVKTAVKMAFDEPKCDAVYLVTDGYIERDPDRITQSILRKSCGRPVHCITVMTSSDELSPTGERFLETLAMNSRGSFHVITLSHLGDVTKVRDVFNATYTPVEDESETGGKLCSVDVSLNNNPYKHLFPTRHPTPYVPFFRYYPYVDTEALKEEVLHSPVASVVARGTRVLARRTDDGYYYTAHIAQEVSGNRNKFLIEFERVRKKRSDFRMQETFFHDIIAYNDALRHSIVADDKVLAPWEDNGKRYGPGKVIRGVEKRSKIGDHRDTDLLVTFWNGVTRTVEKGCALWIPERLYDRVVLELQMPISARKKLIDSRSSEDLSAGYSSRSNNENIFDDNFWDPLHSLRRQLLYYPWLNNGMYYLPTYPLLTPVPKLLRSWPTLIFARPDLFYGSWQWPYYDETTIPYRRRYSPAASAGRIETDRSEEMVAGSNLTKDELRDLVDQQLKEHDDLVREKEKLKKYLKKRKELASSSSSSSSSSEDEDVTIGRADKGISTKPAHLRRYRRRVERPEWKKYWPQTPQPRQHHLPAFEQRRPGLYSTWDDLDLNGGKCENKSAIYEKVQLLKTQSDRERLIEHLKTPYVERPELEGYSPQLGRRDLDLNRHKDRIMSLQRRSQAARANAWAQKEEDHYQKSKGVEESKRRDTLLRIGSEMDRQRDHDHYISNTLEAKSKINQRFRNAFYQKEMDNLNKQQARLNWLQTRRQMHARSQHEKALENDRLQQSRELGRKYRQARHHDLNIRRSVSAADLR